jgi:CheY-like chemotaxis protein
MIIREHWDVLVVDDEPDVLAVTRLALKPVLVYGIPLRIHECTSKADAIKYLKGTAELTDLALAIIDVVMETEHAGLEVCKFIRDELDNRITPIVVRTGQAGKAPEREVIERYDISTYLTKVEATTEKLHTTVVTAVRNYLQTVVYEASLGFAAWLSSQTREGVIRGIPEVVDGVFLTRRDGTTLDSIRFHFCILTDREAIAVGNFKGREAEARALRDRLAKEPSKVINHNGDRFLQSGDDLMISLARTDDAPSFDLVGVTNYRLTPDYVVRAVALFMQCARNRMYATGKPH